MSSEQPELPGSKTLWWYLWRALVKSHRRRPVSFYLMFVVLAVVVLGAQFVYAREDPRKLALFLTLNFVFCFVIMYRAIADAFDILRAHLRERRKVYPETLGDRDFTRALGEKVEREREASGGKIDWPE